ncbi:MAG: diaminopimelate epimerase [Bacteroidia bacterium]|nr:diaminopimelate epimerase [Bacteroidia bacterium]MDW8089153.1 diaminopimelate epimerase [Bacteroidia bacterium]
MRFRKLHATGNDFIALEAGQAEALTVGQRRILCQRRTGIGADGIIAVRPEGEGKLRLDYWNADGAVGSFCGNGARAALWLGYTQWGYEHAHLEAADGLHEGHILGIEPPLVAISLSLRRSPQAVAKNQWFVDTGSPHLLIEVEEDLAAFPVAEKAPPLRWDTRYDPKGVNVSFFQQVEGRWHLRTYERGVEAETLSCGTACVALSALIGAPTLEICTAGGTLRVEKEGSKFWLIGEVCEVFWGEWIAPLSPNPAATCAQTA